ncbi:MAG: hypothetical protein ABIC68_00135 [Candidatus Omnitrophota bacterium]
MKKVKNSIQKEIEKIWPDAQKNISKINKDAIKLLEKGEKNLLAIYNTTKKKTEEIVFKAKREELYYELGKMVASRLTKEQLKNKKIAFIAGEIRKLSNKIRIKK